MHNINCIYNINNFIYFKQYKIDRDWFLASNSRTIRKYSYYCRQIETTVDTTANLRSGVDFKMHTRDATLSPL